MNVGIYIYQDAEVLDFSGPFEVFSTASRLSGTDEGFNTFLVAEKHHPVLARGGFSVNPHYDFSNCPRIDLLIVVGGIHTAEMTKPEVLSWLQAVAPAATLVASVCTGAFILAAGGILTSQTVTTHWEDQADLARQFPLLQVVADRRWVEQDRIITSGGISAGIGMSLHLVGRIAGEPLAMKTARQMEFDWQPAG